MTPGDHRESRPHENAVVQEWIDKAAGDLAVARRESSVATPNHDAVCFHAQQAVEKLMKAVLIARGVQPPFTHDLGVLDDLVQGVLPGWSWPPDELRTLSVAAVRVRYPGFSANAAAAQAALETALAIWPVLTRALFHERRV